VPAHDRGCGQKWGRVRLLRGLFSYDGAAAAAMMMTWL